MATKILYVITKANWGGAQRYVYDLATAAKERGYDVEVAYGEPGLLVGRLTGAGIRTTAVRTLGNAIRPRKDIAAYKELASLFKKRAPDVVHLNSSKAGYLGARAARKAGIKKIIFTAHGWAFNEQRNLLVQRLFEAIQRSTVECSTDVIAVSDSVLEPLLHWDLPTKKIHLIRLGIREPEYLSQDEAREALIKIDPALASKRHNTWVGTIAELHKNKGLDIGVKGWREAKMPQAQWVVIGGGGQEQKLKELAAGDSSIHFLGFVPDAAKYVKAFDLFMLPSRTEALAYVILEAGLAGVPVITNGVGGTGEAVPPEYTPAMAFFEPENPTSLAKMLVRVISDSKNLKEAGQRLAEYVRQKFSFDRMVRDTLALYR